MHEFEEKVNGKDGSQRLSELRIQKLMCIYTQWKSNKRYYNNDKGKRKDEKRKRALDL